MEQTALSPGMRRMLAGAGILVVLAGVQLYVFPERTETYFAWTIEPPLTAVFLGGAYWSSAILEFTAARQAQWENARIAVPGVFVFTTLTFVVTLIHLDRFHLGADFSVATRSVTWAWLVIYATVPAVLALLWHRQRGRPIHRRAAGLPVVLRLLVAAQAAVLLGAGTALLIRPEAAAAAWPWDLTALTGRAIGAWLLSLGLVAVHALIEYEPSRLVPAAYSFVAFAVFQVVALIRYPDDFRWGGAPGIAYLIFLVSALVGGLWARRVSTPEGSHPRPEPSSSNVRTNRTES